MFPYIRIFGRSVGTYGILMAASVVLAFFLSARQMKKRGQSVDDLLIVGAFAVGLGLLAAKLFYIFITYSPRVLLELVRKEDFSFLSGGQVFYGGLLGGIIGAWLGWRLVRTPFGILEDSVVPYLPLAHAIGRIGCLMAGCCHGFAYNGPFAVYYAHSISGLSPQQGYFPLPVAEAVLNVALCGGLLRIRKQKHRKMDLIVAYLSSYGILRFCLEFARGDNVRGFALALSTSQWISLLLLALCAGYLAVRRKKA